MLKKKAKKETNRKTAPEKSVKKSIVRTIKPTVAKKKKIAKEAKEGTPRQPKMEEVHLAAAAERYWEAVGRRKTAVARVRLFTRGEKGIWINGRVLAAYFPHPHFQKIAAEALETMKSMARFRTTVHVRGGGIHAQAEAIRHGTSRALILFNPDFRKRLKRAGFLMRDPRMKERKKFGLKGARRAPQWQKR